jgi:putative toxin-antitoxin system antitoxin component (TIGR02293 family)
MEQACLASLESENTQNLIALCKSGLSANIFDEVADCLQVPGIRLASIINIRKSTLMRRKREGRLNFEESQRLYRIVRLFNMAEKILGSTEHAREWLNTPSREFEGKSPLDYSDNEIGAREAEAVLDRIGDGVIF